MAALPRLEHTHRGSYLATVGTGALTWRPWTVLAVSLEPLLGGQVSDLGTSGCTGWHAGHAGTLCWTGGRAWPLSLCFYHLPLCSADQQPARTHDSFTTRGCEVRSRAVPVLRLLTASAAQSLALGQPVLPLKLELTDVACVGKHKGNGLNVFHFCVFLLQKCLLLFSDTCRFLTQR